MIANNFSSYEAYAVIEPPVQQGVPSDVNQLVNIQVRSSLTVSLRNFIANKLGVLADDWENRTVFFQQYSTCKTYKDTFKEFKRKGIGMDKIMKHVIIDISPLLNPKVEHWYKIIRYCLYCFKHTQEECVVLGPPRNGRLDLFILVESHHRWEKASSPEQRLIHKVMALQIGLWLSRPVYLASLGNGGIRPQFYVARAVYEAVSYHGAGSMSEFKKILKERYTISSQIVTYFGHYDLIRYRYQQLICEQSGELSLSVKDLLLWIKFNYTFKDTTFVPYLRSCNALLAS